MFLSGSLLQYSEPRQMWITLDPPDTPSSGCPGCPRCRSHQAQRWGRFGNRPRYRCKECGKTYNALTGTPLARLKHRNKWALLGLCLLEGLSVRGSAEVLDVSASTAFRWRHRFLDTLRTSSRPRMSGVSEPTLASLIAYRRRLFDWATPFRGVSRRHYSNYLTWFHFVDERRDLDPGNSLTELLSQLFPTLEVKDRRWTLLDDNRTRPFVALKSRICGGVIMSTNNDCVQNTGNGREGMRGAGGQQPGGKVRVDVQGGGGGVGRNRWNRALRLG